MNRLRKPTPEMSSDTDPTPRPLRIVGAQKEGKQALDHIPTIEGLPWKVYEKIYNLRLGESEPVTVAERKGISCELVSIRRISGAAVDQRLEMIRLIQHKNFVTAHEVYRNDDYYVVFEHMHLSLQEIVANPYLNDARLAAIVGQILVALAYLEDKGLQHGLLTCSQILVHSNGTVKLCPLTLPHSFALVINQNI